MTNKEIVYWIILAVILLSITSYGIYSLYYAYVKSKDERQKSIVTRAIKHTFAVIFIYSLLDMILRLTEIPLLSQTWKSICNSIQIELTFGMFFVMGICLFINKRLAGGD